MIILKSQVKTIFLYIIIILLNISMDTNRYAFKYIQNKL